MNKNTGELVTFEANEVITDDYIPVTRDEFKSMKDMKPDDRKNWMRNKPCPCGSGKKFKKCHWRNPEGL